MSDIWNGSHGIPLEVGRAYVHDAVITRLHVSEGEKVTIYEGPNLGAKLAAAPFLVGNYPHIQLVPHPHARAMKDGRPKLIVTEETKVEERELLVMWWLDRSRKCEQKLEPGDWTALNWADFRNDIIEYVKVPPNASVVFSDNVDGSGGRIEFTQEGTYELDSYGLKRRVSSITYALDGWDEVRRDLGKTISKVEQGDPIIIETGLSGFPGSYTEQYVDFKEAEEESTNWHLNQTVTASVKIGGEASSVSTEWTTSTEAGGGGEKGSSDESTFGSKVGATLPPAPESHSDDPNFQWNAKITSTARRYRVKQEIIRVLRNNRTGEETTQTGMVDGKKLEAYHSSNLAGVILRVMDDEHPT